MAMPQVPAKWTADLVRALPDDGNRYELVDGALLVTPAPSLRHQETVFALIRRLDPYVLRRGLGRLLASPADISLGEDEILQPDLFVAPLIAGRRPDNWKDVHGLLLAVEVLSPSTARYDRHDKRKRFQRAGVPEYWIVDLDNRRIERWGPGDLQAEIITETLSWHPEGASESLVIDLPRLFLEVWGEGA
jgi:Uma2 family endonuclease